MAPNTAEQSAPRDEAAPRRTVVVTGASGGIGRATVRAFARRGDAVGLLARGEKGLEAAADEVRELGGEPLAVPTDTADPHQVEAAAEAVTKTLGPIDVWVNCAFTSVFAPFTEISPEEYRRVTEVTYLGFVHGTLAALTRMQPRDRGVIVQVGSALGYRGIPLQSAYCGAKHAVNGFTESVRTELMHQGSGVRITVVQMPAVNTPQFSWVLSRMGRHPQPVPPIYEPEVAADAIVFASEHPERKQYYVGTSTALTVVGNKFAAGLLDRYLARTGYDSQQTDQKAKPGRPANLWEPADGPDGADFGARGEFTDKSHGSDPQLWLSRHARIASGLGGLAAAGTGVLAGRLLGRRRG